mgnify:FL=1
MIDFHGRFPKEAKISGRASGDEKTPESGNGLRNCIFEALLFVPPDTNAWHEGSKRKINTCVLPYIQGSRRKTRTNKPIHLQLNEVWFYSYWQYLSFKGWEGYVWFLSVDTKLPNWRVSIIGLISKSIYQKEGKKKPSGKKMKTSFNTSEWLSCIFIQRFIERRPSCLSLGCQEMQR